MKTPRKDLADYENKYVINVCGKFPFAIVKGEGMYVFDDDGEKWLDLYGGHAVAITGHCHPRVVHAIRQQAEKLLFYSNVTYSELRAQAAELIVKMAHGHLTKVYFGNSGAEANEAAIKFARKYTKRNRIIAMEGAFHGRTFGALSLTWGDHYRRPFEPLVPGIDFVPFGDLEAVKNAINRETSAVILEPIQSVAGVKMADPDYYKGLRDVTEDKKVLLIFDEIQTGLGRTGKNFFGDHYGIVPDMITIAKGLASGIPISATIVTENIAREIHPGDHASTFGGGPIACAAAIATLNIIEKERLADNARKVGDYASILFPGILGKGLLRGIVADKEHEDAKSLIAKARDRHIIIGGSGDPHVARLLPPLIVNKSHLDQLREAINP
ncbi:MAG: aspartate aminotransferase family protein [Candidatus Ranarchaeia archaeon]